MEETQLTKEEIKALAVESGMRVDPDNIDPHTAEGIRNLFAIDFIQTAYRIGYSRGLKEGEKKC